MTRLPIALTLILACASGAVAADAAGTNGSSTRAPASDGNMSQPSKSGEHRMNDGATAGAKDTPDRKPAQQDSTTDGTLDATKNPGPTGAGAKDSADRKPAVSTTPASDAPGGASTTTPDKNAPKTDGPQPQSGSTTTGTNR